MCIEAITNEFKENMIKAEIEHNDNDLMQNQVAQNPFLLINVEDDDISFYTKIENQILKKWHIYSKFRDIVKFIKIEGNQNNISAVDSNNMELNLFNDIINPMLNSDNGFADMNRIKIYFIINLRNIKDVSEIEHKQEQVEELINLVTGFYDKNVMEIFLVDESVGNEECSKSIKKNLSNIFSDIKVNDNDRNIFIVGNRNSNGNNISDEMIINTVAELIYVTNCGNTDIENYLTGSYFNAVGYNYHSKPRSEIANICLAKILSNIKIAINNIASNDSTNKDELLIKLNDVERAFNNGFNEFVLNRIKYLKDKNIIEGFPRDNSEHEINLDNITSDELDGRTLGAWSAFSEEQVEEWLSHKTDEALTEEICFCLDKLSIFESGYLNNKLTEIINGASTNNLDGSFYEAFFNNYRLLKLLRKCVNDKAIKADETLRQFDNICNDASNYICTDNDLETYYANVINGYALKTNYAEALKNVSDIEDLISLVKKCCVDVIYSYPIFQYGFSEEMETRLEGKKQNIADRQVHNNFLTVYPYLRTVETMNNMLKIVIVKHESWIDERIKATVNAENLESVIFLDSKFDDSADSLWIYKLGREHLLR